MNGKPSHDHSGLLAQVREKLPREELFRELAGLYSIFADPTRVMLLYALWESEMCVCALTELSGLSQSAVSHQLRTLREGKQVYYALADAHVRMIIEMGFEHLTEDRQEETGR